MQRRIERKNLRDGYLIERNHGRQRGDANNNAVDDNNRNNDAVKTHSRGHEAMTAGEARQLAHAARAEEHNVHFRSDGDASTAAAVDGAEGRSDADDFSAPLPVRKPRVEATQFKWAQLQVGGPAPGFRGTVRGEKGRDDALVVVVLRDGRGWFRGGECRFSVLSDNNCAKVLKDEGKVFRGWLSLFVLAPEDCLWRVLNDARRQGRKEDGQTGSRRESHRSEENLFSSDTKA